MRRIYFKITIIGILIILTCPVVLSETVYEPNNFQLAKERPKPIISQERKENNITKELFSHFDILLGFVLGLFGTCFVDHLQQRQKTKEFYQVMHTELKQTLATMCVLALNPDANITKDMVGSVHLTV